MYYMIRFYHLFAVNLNKQTYILCKTDVSYSVGSNIVQMWRISTLLGVLLTK